MRLLFVVMGVWLGCMSPAWAETFAGEQDITELQNDLQNLEAELESAQQNNARLPSDYSDRVQDIRNNVIYLRVKMKRHQEAKESGTGVEIAEVREVRSDIAALRADLARLRDDTTEESVTLSVGTLVSVRLQDSLGTATSQQGDVFTATAVEPVTRRGYVALPAGAAFHGVVEVVDRPEGRTDRKARLVLAIDEVELEGLTHSVSATVTDASEQLETGIGDEKTKVGVGAGIGGILGAVLGGKKGAVVGAVLGGTGAILATEGKDVDLPRGAILKLRLDRELTLPILRERTGSNISR